MSSIRFPYLKEFVYGGIDGCITTFAVVAGGTGADLNSGVIIILGFANLIADGFSMSVGNYLSVKSEFAYQQFNGRNGAGRSPLQTAIATFISFQIMGLIPLLAYVTNYLNAIENNNLFIVSSVLTGVAFVCIGLLRSYVTKTSMLKSVLETLSLGGIAAYLAYFVGNVLGNMF